jgi:hypothetical protein
MEISDNHANEGMKDRVVLIQGMGKVLDEGGVRWLIGLICE